MGVFARVVFALVFALLLCVRRLPGMSGGGGTLLSRRPCALGGAHALVWARLSCARARGRLAWGGTWLSRPMRCGGCCFSPAVCAWKERGGRGRVLLVRALGAYNTLLLVAKGAVLVWTVRGVGGGGGATGACGAGGYNPRTAKGVGVASWGGQCWSGLGARWGGGVDNGGGGVGVWRSVWVGVAFGGGVLG